MKFTLKKQSGYSSQLFNQIFGNETTAISLSTEADVRMKYADGQRTDKIDSYRYTFVIKGQNPFEVKFSESQGIAQFDEVELINPEACEVRGNIYFRADSVTVLKKGGK